MAEVEGRLENLLGVVMLAAEDRVRPAVEADIGQRGAAAGALIHLVSYPGESTEQLARVLGISQPGALAVVERLVANGLLERRPGVDRRTLALHPTRDGIDIAERVLSTRRGRLADLLSPLGAEERAQLTGMLETVVAHLADDRPQARTTCRLCDRLACCAGPGCPLDHTVA